MGEEQIKDIRQNIGDGRIIEMHSRGIHRKLVSEMVREKFSPTNYEALLPAFMTLILEKAQDNGPILLSMVAFQQDLVIPVATYFYEGTRYFATAINTIILEEFSTTDVDNYGDISSNKFLESLRELQMPKEFEAEILSGITRKVEVMMAYLEGKVLESELIYVTPPGIEPGLHD